jgi:hypothetical protein
MCVCVCVCVSGVCVFVCLDVSVSGRVLVYESARECACVCACVFVLCFFVRRYSHSELRELAHNSKASLVSLVRLTRCRCTAAGCVAATMPPAAKVRAKTMPRAAGAAKVNAAPAVAGQAVGDAAPGSAAATVPAAVFSFNVRHLEYIKECLRAIGPHPLAQDIKNVGPLTQASDFDGCKSVDGWRFGVGASFGKTSAWTPTSHVPR